jgi:hypothetical protein
MLPTTADQQIARNQLEPGSIIKNNYCNHFDDLRDEDVTEIIKYLYVDEGVKLCMTCHFFERISNHQSCVWELHQIPISFAHEENRLEFIDWVNKNDSCIDMMNKQNHKFGHDHGANNFYFKLLFSAGMVREKYNNINMMRTTCSSSSSGSSSSMMQRMQRAAQNDLRQAFSLVADECEGDDDDLEDYESAQYNDDTGVDY